MATLSFKDRITNLAGSLGTASDTMLEQWLIDGCYDIVNKILKMPQSTVSSHQFAKQSSVYNSAMSVDLSEIRWIEDVERGGYSCQKVSHTKRKFVDPSDSIGANSIYKATSSDPVYYIFNNTLTVKPNPTASEQGYYTYIPEYSISNFTSTDSQIDSFPKAFYEAVLLYGSIKTVLHLLNAFNLDNDKIKVALDQAATAGDKLAAAQAKYGTLFTDLGITQPFGDSDTFNTSSMQLTRVKDALDNAEKLIDDGANSMTGSASQDVASYLSDEDTELVSSALSIVSSEIQRAQAHASEWNTVLKGISDQRGAIGQELEAIVKEMSSALQEAAGYLNRDKTKYEWYMNTLKSLQGEYNSLFAVPQQAGGQ